MQNTNANANATTMLSLTGPKLFGSKNHRKTNTLPIADRPAQLFYIGISICNDKNMRNTAGKSATLPPTAVCSPAWP